MGKTMQKQKAAAFILAILFMVGFIGGCTESIKTGAFTFSPSLRDPDISIDVYIPDQAFKGTTLFADYHDPAKTRIIEVNMKGEIVWEYILPSNLMSFTNPGFDVECLSNNNILFLLPGKGVYEINRQGEMVWSYADAKVSHDVDRLPNGNTLIAWGGGDTPDDAQVKEVNPKGEIVWTWCAKNYFSKSPFKDIYEEGWTHTNKVTRLPDGNTLISLRNFHITLIVDPQGSVVWSFSWKGLGSHPHSPRILSNGSILAALRKPHRVVEVNPNTGKIEWEFSMPGVETIRDADPLPNGNILIVERTKIIEVTPAGEICWQLNIKAPGNRPLQKDNWLYTAERIPL